MRRYRHLNLGCLLSLTLWVAAVAQETRPQSQRPATAAPIAPSVTPSETTTGERPAGEARPETAAARPPVPEPPEEKPVITHHELRVGGKTLKYTTTTGLMPIRDNIGKLEARIFYMAY